MDPAMALYQAQLYRHYWEQHQQQHAVNRSALESSQWPPYVAPVFGLPSSNLAGQPPQSDPAIRSSNVEMYSRIFNSIPPSSSNGLACPTSSPTISTPTTTTGPPSFFNPYWNFFASPSDSLLPPSNVPHWSSLPSTMPIMPTMACSNNYLTKSGLEIKIERPSPPISRSKNCNRNSNLVTSSKKKEPSGGGKRSSLHQREHCLQSPSSSSTSRTNSSPDKRSASRTSLVCRLPCDSSSEMVPPTPPSSSLNLEDHHDESDSEKDCGALVICGFEELQDDGKVEESPQVVSSISPILLKRKSSAACQTWEEEEDLLIDLVNRASIPLGNHHEKTSSTYVQPRWCMRPAQLELVKVEPPSLLKQNRPLVANSSLNGLPGEDKLLVSTCDAAVTSTIRSERGSSSSADLLLISPRTTCADLVQQSRCTQTRSLKRVLCDGCNKKCRLRKKDSTALTAPNGALNESPMEVKHSIPSLHFPDALLHFAQSHSKDINPVTASVTQLCNAFVNDFLIYKDNLDVAEFESNVMNRLVNCLESLQKNLVADVDTQLDAASRHSLLQQVINSKRCLSAATTSAIDHPTLLTSSKSCVSFCSTLLSDDDKALGKIMSSTPSLKKCKCDKSFLASSQPSSGYNSTCQLDDSLDNTQDVIKIAIPSDSYVSCPVSKSLCINMASPVEVEWKQSNQVAQKQKQTFLSDSSSYSTELIKRPRFYEDLTGSSKNILELSRTPPPSLEREAPLLEMRPSTPQLRSSILNRIDLYDGQRILVTVDGNWFAATLQVDTRRGGADMGYFSAALDGGRQLSLSRDQLLNSAILEVQPDNRRQLPYGSRIAAYFTSEATNPLFAGTVSQSFHRILTDSEVFVKFDDGDERIVNIECVRLLPVDTPVMSADARGDIFLSVPRRPRQKVQRQQSHFEVGRTSSSSMAAISDRRRKSTSLSSPTGISTATPKELAVTAPAVGNAPVRQFKWGDVGVPKGRKIKHKNLLCNGQSLRIGDVAQFLSGEGERPYLGRIEDLIEENGHMWVRATWYYQPSEMGVAGQPFLHTPAAIFCSTHSDTNEIQTVLKAVRVLSLLEYRRRNTQDLFSDDVFFEAGIYDAVRCRVKTVFEDVNAEDVSDTLNRT